MTRASKRRALIHLHWKGVLQLIFFIVFVFSGIWIANQFNSSPRFPIKTVKVMGAKHISHQSVEHLLSPLVSRSFFDVEVESIKDRLIQISWVSTVNVRRIWPDQVVVTIVEKNPVAFWNEASVLSSGGDLFIPEAGSEPDHLPKFFGPDGKQIYMMQYYNKISTILIPLHFKIVRLELTPTHLWNLTLNNGMKLTANNKDFLTRFSHFVKVYPRIIGSRANNIDNVDLRYPSGLAVKWKSVT